METTILGLTVWGTGFDAQHVPGAGIQDLVGV